MKKTILFIVSLLFGLLFINAGLNKFFNYMPTPTDLPPGLMEAMGGMMAMKWLMPLVGFGEVLGGLLVIFPKSRALGAVVLFPIVVGIVLTAFVNVQGGYAMALGVLVVELWIIIENSHKYTPMLEK
ncbi:DoxX-like protein [Chitinophaga skermanii]|uniref:DoxX-like protein n=1 Tax=Chitinophaga skermanii TaxID=331697 RepID=A0A327QWX2_9BACT|nr:DoxX family membrane protein [Chitinophaga skermanii]RAJ08860.1 DoxX-like protein [Chitinophaga skermanii]